MKVSDREELEKKDTQIDREGRERERERETEKERVR